MGPNSDFIVDLRRAIVAIMKPLQVAEDIVPLGVFKAQASKILRQLRGTMRPVVITQNGRPAAVILSPEEFDRLNEARRFVSSVEAGLADVAAGRVVEDRELGKELDREFGALEDE
jgi:prevent-host-death family protein